MPKTSSPVLKLLFGLCLVIASLIVVGCGDDGDSGDVPENSVATVDGVPITRSAYDKMHASTEVANEDPKQARIAAMQILLQREWTDQEAEDEGIKVSDAEIRRALLEQRAQFFKKASAYQTYLRKSKRTEADLYAGMKQKLLMDKLTARAVQEAPQIDDERVADYYEKNRREFALPERRLAHALIVKTEASANEARREAEAGTGWKQIFKTYSPKGGQAPDAWKLQTLTKTGIKELDQRLLETQAGDSFVAKTDYGWVLISVEKILPSKQQPLDEVKAGIRTRLIGSRREDASNDFLQDFQKEYKDKSVCADGYLVAECSNGPDENPQPKPPSAERPSSTTPDEEADK